MTRQAGVTPYYNILHQLRKLSVSSVTSGITKLLLIVWGHGKQHNRLFGINTSVMCCFQQMFY